MNILSGFSIFAAGPAGNKGKAGVGELGLLLVFVLRESRARYLSKQHINGPPRGSETKQEATLTQYYFYIRSTSSNNSSICSNACCQQILQQ